MKTCKLTLLLVAALLFCSCSSTYNNESMRVDSNNEPTVLEIPSPYFNLQNNAKNPWDMVVYNGYLYVGGGDYDLNISPQKAYRFNLTDEEWETCGDIPDEQILNFRIIDGELYIPGTDPTADWTYGNFYKLENESFVTYRTIPNAVHCFDLERHDGKLFAAIAVKDSSFPVVVSNDNGNSFERITVVTGGNNLITNERVYCLFKLNQSLYAIWGNDIYEYDGNAFRFACSWENQFAQGYSFYSPVGAQAAFKNKIYLTSGYLFCAEDVNELEYIPFENNVVTDILVQCDKLYVLCFSKNDEGSYTNSIKRSDNGKDFETVYEFEYPYSALSFAINENDIFLGIGGTTENNDNKGLILRVEDVI